LIVESIEQDSSSKAKKVVKSKNYDDYAKLKSENEKLKKDLEKASTTNAIVIENLDGDEELALENENLKEENKRLKFEMPCIKQTTNESLIEENKKLKLEKEHLKVGLSKFAKGKSLQSEATHEHHHEDGYKHHWLLGSTREEGTSSTTTSTKAKA